MLSIEAIDDLSSRISGFILKALILGSLLADFFVVAPLPSGQDCRQGLKLNRPAGECYLPCKCPVGSFGLL